MRERSPLLHDFITMDMDARWVERSAQAMLATFPWFHGEGFGLIVDDLLQLPPQPRIIAEGFRLLPRLMAPLLSLPHGAVWLLPTPGFREPWLNAGSARSGVFFATRPIQ